MIIPQSRGRRITLNAGQTIFSQIMDFLPRSEFRRCVNR
ncbi:MAG: DUF4372 domain-containing protein, partial [bacterium]